MQSWPKKWLKMGGRRQPGSQGRVPVYLALVQGEEKGDGCCQVLGVGGTGRKSGQSTGQHSLEPQGQRVPEGLTG